MKISSLLQSLIDDLRDQNPKVPAAAFSEIAGRVSAKVENEPPPRVAFIGQTGVGKSSTLNALFNAGQLVSHTKAQTQEEHAIEVMADTVDGEKGVLLVYDMPGLGESIAKRTKHTETYQRVLSSVDVALWVLDAQNRAIEPIQIHLQNELSAINPELVQRLTFAVNKVDLIHPGADSWIAAANIPSEEQEQNIAARIADISEKISEAVPLWQGSIVGYSATRRFQLPQLFNSILDAVPTKRQWVLSSRKALADWFELVDPQLLPPERRTARLKSDLVAANAAMRRIVESLTPEQFRVVADNRDAFLKFLEEQQ